MTDYADVELKPIPQHTERGIPLLRKVWEQIKADHRAWNQNTWIGTPEGEALERRVVEYIKEHQAPPWNCGTAYCVAGHGALAAGAKLPPSTVSSVVDYGGNLSTSSVITPGGKYRNVDDYAREVFDLSEGQASVLFTGGNEAWQIECYVRALEADPGANLWNVDWDSNYSEQIAWEVEYGFRNPPHRAGAVRRAVEHEFPYRSDRFNEYLTLIVLTTPPAEITDEKVYAAQVLQDLGGNYDEEDDSIAWADVSASRRDELAELAERLRAIGNEHRS